MASDKKVHLLRNSLHGFGSLSADQFISRASWGEINFENVRAEITDGLALVHQLASLPIEPLNDRMIDRMKAALDQFQQALNDIGNFKVTQGDPVGQRDQISAAIRNAYQDIFEAIAPIVPFLLYTSGDIRKNIDELSNNVAKSKGILIASEEDSAAKKKEIEEIVAQAREVSASVGVAHFTVQFSAEADALNATSKKWLIASALMGLVTILFSGLSFFFWTDVQNISQAIFRGISKFFFLSVLVGTTVWCGRTYRAIKHLETINRHRSNSLRTFQAFIGAASTDQVRDTVLTEAARSIFVLAPTGYVDQEPAGDNRMSVMEVAKTATDVVKLTKATP